MGDCIYCGRPAGLMRSRHPDCQNKYDDALCKILDVVRASLNGTGSFGSLKPTVATLAAGVNLPDAELRSTLARGWTDAVEGFLQNGLLDIAEEQRLSSFQQLLGLSQQDLNIFGGYTRVAQAAVLRDLAGGKLPSRVSVAGGVPVNLQRGESIIWAFRNVEMMEDKTRREYVGRSQGVSFRVMKGVHYRIGSFKGTPIDKTERVLVDSGMLVVTDRNIYFSGPQKSVRIPFEKVVAFHPYDNGVGIMRDAANAKAQVFVTGDGWFTYNLLVSVAAI